MNKVSVLRKLVILLSFSYKIGVVRFHIFSCRLLIQTKVIFFSAEISFKRPFALTNFLCIILQIIPENVIHIDVCHVKNCIWLYKCWTSGNDATSRFWVRFNKTVNWTFARVGASRRAVFSVGSTVGCSQLRRSASWGNFEGTDEQTKLCCCCAASLVWKRNRRKVASSNFKLRPVSTESNLSAMEWCEWSLTLSVKTQTSDFSFDNALFATTHFLHCRFNIIPNRDCSIQAEALHFSACAKMRQA